MGKQKSKKYRKSDLELGKREERRWRKLINSNLHHYNPTSRNPRFISEIRPRFPIILKETGWTENELIEKIYAVKIVDVKIHEAWHELFSSMFAWEAVAQIKLWGMFDLDNFKIFLSDRIKNAWDLVFGAQSMPREAIEIVKAEWWPEWPPVDKEEYFL